MATGRKVESLESHSKTLEAGHGCLLLEFGRVLNVQVQPLKYQDDILEGSYGELESKQEVPE